MSLEGDDSLEDTVSGVLSTGSEVISISGGGGGGSSSSSDHTATDIETANAETKLREQLVIHRRHLFKMCSFQSTESVKTPLCSLCSLPAAFRCFSCGNGGVYLCAEHDQTQHQRAPSIHERDLLLDDGESGFELQFICVLGRCGRVRALTLRPYAVSQPEKFVV